MASGRKGAGATAGPDTRVQSNRCGTQGNAVMRSTTVNTIDLNRDGKQGGNQRDVMESQSRPKHWVQGQARAGTVTKGQRVERHPRILISLGLVG